MSRVEADALLTAVLVGYCFGAGAFALVLWPTERQCRESWRSVMRLLLPLFLVACGADGGGAWVEVAAVGTWDPDNHELAFEAQSPVEAGGPVPYECYVLDANGASPPPKGTRWENAINGVAFRGVSYIEDGTAACLFWTGDIQ